MSMSNDRGRAFTGVPGPYILCELLTNVQTSEDYDDKGVRITCVEFWNDNLYVGTSAGEVIHYVLIPPAQDQPGDDGSFIQASRLSVNDDAAQPDPQSVRGIQQIVIVPSAGRVCLLSDGILKFYSLPELSPAYSLKVPKVSWVGGVNENTGGNQETGQDSDVVTVGLRNKINLIRLGHPRPDKIADIGLGGCLVTCRRDHIACFADSKSYSLVDVVEQQSIPLFEISSQDTSSAEEPPSSTLHSSTPEAGPDGSDGTHSEGPTGSDAPPQTVRPGEGSEASSSEPAHPTALPARMSSLPAGGHSRTTSTASTKTTTNQPPPRLQPHIVSPSPSEFLLTTGTDRNEPGVGIFVNTDGDVVRGTLEFAKYPSSLAVDGQGVDPTELGTAGDQSQEEGFVLAVLPRSEEKSEGDVLEIQRWDVDPGDANNHKSILQLPDDHKASRTLGVKKALTEKRVAMSQISRCLKLEQVDLHNILAQQLKEVKARYKDRDRSEQTFISRLAFASGRIIVWTEMSIWWAVRTPLVVHLDARLESAIDDSSDATVAFIDRYTVAALFDDLRGREPQSELDFLAIGYIRQKASLLLFLDLVDQSFDQLDIDEQSLGITERTLIEGELDPRVILAVIPILQHEIEQSSGGSWIQGGLKSALQAFLRRRSIPPSLEIGKSFTEAILQLVKGYLLFWRQRKGFGSVSDEKEVFRTVDASLLRLLLYLDREVPKGYVKTATRNELYALVDSGVDCFEHAVGMLEEHKRLYVLSRLYNSRKMPAQVLATWKRVMEGEEDAGGELVNGEDTMRTYLAGRTDVKLIEDYGCWLANRNPQLGVRVFGDAESKVKFDPREAIDLLQKRAPSAVKFYIEHLVFGRNLAQYANDLIGYYLDTVLQELESSPASKEALLDSYAAYRSLKTPKPTYLQFATDNALDADWWQARLRLLQLLGGSHGAASQYDVPAILARIDPYKEELVPEMITIGGKQGRHKEAIHLLVNSLGDYDTAVTYCFLGGSSTYSPAIGPRMVESLPSHEEQAGLFRHLLHEFMHLEEAEVRMRQSSELLDRFSTWFDVADVLRLVPDTWPVEAVSSFLQRALRTLLTERHESSIVMALTGSENLNVAAQLVEKTSIAGARLDAGQAEI